MADYGFRGKTKPTKEFPRGLSKGLRTMDLGGRKVEKTSVEAQGADTTPQLFRCSVDGCKKTFKAKHLAASHFRGKHKDLNVEKETWRNYVDQVED